MNADTLTPSFYSPPFKGPLFESANPHTHHGKLAMLGKYAARDVF
jgi:hypothetical protein